MNDTTATENEPAPPWAPPPLVRPREGRVIAGVAAGIADRLGVGSGWVRAAFVIACIFGGLGILLYIVGWLAIPEVGDSESIAASKVADLKGSSRWLGVALIVVGGLLVLSWSDAVRGELVWAGALVLVGVLLYRGEFPAPRPAAPSPPPPPPPPASAHPMEDPAPGMGAVPDETEESTVESTSGAVSVAPPPPPPSPPTAPKPKPPRSMLGRFTLAAMLIAVGALALLDNGGVIEPEARHYLAAIVGVAGLGLITGAWVGRSRGLIAVGILLLPALLVTSVVRVPFSGDVGEESFRPNDASAVAAEYRLGAGDLLVDLRDVDPGAGVVDFEATVGAGRLRVLVPRDVTVFVDGRVGFGELIVFGISRSGVGREFLTAPSAGATSHINARVEVGFGQVEVIRVGDDDGGALFSISRDRDCVAGSLLCRDAG